MSKRRRRWVEHLKTLAILLLSLSAVYLLLRINLIGGPAEGPLSALSGWLSGAKEPAPGQTEPTGGLVRPLRLVVSNPQLAGRYGVQYDQEALDARFGGALLNLFSDALTSAGAGRQVTPAQWQRALTATDRPLIYLDLMGSVSGGQLPVWMGGRAENPNLTGQVRRLLLTAEPGGGVLLYYSNEADGSYYACNTAAELSQRLTDAVGEFEPNNAMFACEDPVQYAGLAPMTLILADAPRPAVYAAANPVPKNSEEQARLLQDLGFYPQSSTVNLVDVSVREGTDSLRISPVGVVSFYSATPENPRFPVGDGETPPTEGQMVSAALDLLERCASGRIGAARLLLYGTGQEDGGTALYFSYELNGVPVQVGSDSFAARIFVEGGRIAAFTLQLRSYTDAGTTSIVLPEVQAAAAMEALGARGGELILCYRDQRGDQVSAGWIAS